jgi:hypothetical protein
MKMRIYASFVILTVPLLAQIPGVPKPRDAWQNPNQVISALQFSPSENVAWVESGYPYFAPRIVPLVKKVYAVNTDPRAFQGQGMLPPGVIPIVSTTSDPNVASLSLDTIILVDVLQQQLITSSIPYYLNVLAGLKPGGRLVIIDRNLPSVYPSSLVVSPADLEQLLPLIGFNLTQEFTFLPYQYFLVFQLCPCSSQATTKN